MAYVGFRHPVAAIGTYTDGAAPVYANGFVVGKAISGSLSLNRSSEVLYGDDATVDTDNSITGGTVTLETDDIAMEAEAKLMGFTYDESTKTVQVLDTAAPDVGFGYLRVRRVKGVRTFVAYWIYKVKFGSDSESMQTKADRVQFGTTTINGDIMVINMDASGNNRVFDKCECADEASAIAWLNGKAGISA